MIKKLTVMVSFFFCFRSPFSVLRFPFSVFRLMVQRFRSAHDVDQFGGNHILTCPVVFATQLL